jgi:hypothetical protein
MICCGNKEDAEQKLKSFVSLPIMSNRTAAFTRGGGDGNDRLYSGSPLAADKPLKLH